MVQSFRVRPTTQFKRELEKLFERQPELTVVVERLNDILKSDPYNRSRQYPIKKLSDVKQGEGQWRIRSGVWRLRYDVFDKDVVLYSFKHRKEAY
ncbi:MAG: type II toxin-antitoxin system RelE/ParE family toxin [Candidatus Kryptoniota bacterium]